MNSEKVIKKLDELRLLRGSLRRRLEAQNPVGMYGYKNKNKNIGIIEITKEFSVEQIAKSAEYSYMYAYSILNKKPFKLGEPAIAMDAQYSYLYAYYVLHKEFQLNKPFKLGEPVIAKNAEYSYLYAHDVLLKEFKLGEPAIAKSAYYSYKYASNVLDEPFILGEPAIAKSAKYSYRYALDALHLPESEAKKWGKNYKTTKLGSIKGAKTLYHGTSSKKGYQGILSNGLNSTESDYSELSKPLEGGSYLTSDFGNAARYACMPNSNYQESRSKEPFGYVFEFSTKDIEKTSPDEDELGAAFAKLIGKKSLPSFLLKVVSSIPNDLKERYDANPDSFELYASLGKWLIKNNKLTDPVMSYLSRDFKNIVNYGVIHPIAVWVFQKPSEQFLRDRQDTFNSFNGWASWVKRYGKRTEL